MQKLYYNDKRKETITCPCGSIILRCNKSSHEKTKVHANYMSTRKLPQIKITKV